MENILCEEPLDCMITVREESVSCIRKAALEKRLTTNKLAIRAGIDRNVVERLYYKNRIRQTDLLAICDVVFGTDYKILWKEKI